MKTIVISGGCGLLGNQFAQTLWDDGHCVVVLDLPNKVKKYDLDNYTEIAVDITNEQQVKDVVEYVYNISGIDILINCAAINPIPKDGEDSSFEYYSLDKWKQTLDVNLTGAFLLSRECVKYMLKNNKEGFKGTIINIASDLGIITSDQSIYENEYKKPVDYGVSKAGLIHLTKYIACYYGDKIKCIALAPGSVYNGQSDTLKKNLEDKIPIGRLAKVNEYNEAIKFLCGSGSNYMQGQTLIMDGGRTIW